MRLTVLGSGTCVPSGKRASAGYFVETGSVKLRLDCGAGTLHAMARFGLPWEDLTHQVVSHFHVDHVGELPALLFAFRHGRRAPRTAPLVLVGPAGLRPLVEGLEAAFGRPLLEQEFPVEIRELSPGESLSLDRGGRLAVAKTPHTAESLAIRIDDAEGKSLGYTGDTAPSPELAHFFRGVDVLVAECSFLEDRRGLPHLAADDAATLAAAAGAQRLVATHSYFDPARERLAERLARRFAGEVFVAEDGLTVTA